MFIKWRFIMYYKCINLTTKIIERFLDSTKLDEKRMTHRFLAKEAWEEAFNHHYGAQTFLWTGFPALMGHSHFFCSDIHTFLEHRSFLCAATQIMPFNIYDISSTISVECVFLTMKRDKPLTVKMVLWSWLQSSVYLIQAVCQGVFVINIVPTWP